MYGSSRLTLVLGAAPDNTAPTDVLKSYVRALAEVGLAVLFVQPGTKIPADYRSAPAKKKAAAEGDDRAGLYLATTDKTALARYVTAARKSDPEAALNLAIHPGRSRLVVIDADTEEEVAAWRGWWEENGGPDLLVPPTVQTPGAQDKDGNWKHRNGGHWYLTLPEGYDLPEDAPAKITVKHGGGQFTAYAGDCYVLIPPSTRPEGRYEVVGTDYPAPQALLDRLVATERAAKKEKAQTPRREETEVERTAWDASQEEAVAAARQEAGLVSLEDWLEETPWADILQDWTPASLDKCGCQTWTAPGVHDSPKSAVTHECGDHIDGGRLHVWTDNPSTGTALDDEVQAGRRDFSKLQAGAFLYFDGDVTAAMDAAGIDRTTAASGGSVVDWKTGEITRPADKERRAAKEDGITPDDWDDGVGLADEEKVSTAPFGLASIGELWDLQPPAFLVSDTIQDKALTAIIGQSGAGKSFVALDMLCSIVAGIPWQGRQTIQRRALYVAGEGVTGAIQRVKAWVEMYGYEEEIREHLYVIPSAVALHDWRVDQWRDLRDLILEREIGLVVLDTWARVTAGMEENSSKEVGHVIKHLDRMKDRTGAGMMVVHHTTRGTTHGRGSTALLGALDSEVLVAPGEEEETIAVTVTKQKNGREWESAMVFTLAQVGPSAVLADSDGLVDPTRTPEHFYRSLNTMETVESLAFRLYQLAAGRYALNGATEAELRSQARRPQKDDNYTAGEWRRAVSAALNLAVEDGLLVRPTDSGPWRATMDPDTVDRFTRSHHLEV